MCAANLINDVVQLGTVLCASVKDVSHTGEHGDVELIEVDAETVKKCLVGKYMMVVEAAQVRKLLLQHRPLGDGGAGGLQLAEQQVEVRGVQVHSVGEPALRGCNLVLLSFTSVQTAEV